MVDIRTRAVRWAVAILLLAFPARAQKLVARKIVDPSDLSTGRGVLGKVGDYFLANDRIRVVIDDIGKRQGFAESGGNIVDAARREQNIDLLTQLITYFDNSFPRQAIYDRAEILKNGSDGREARIRVSGVEMKDKKIRVTTEYSVQPGAYYVLVETTLTNTGAETIQNFELGDAVQWGFTEHFAPGAGTDLGGKTLSGLEWLAGAGDGVSYGYTIKSGEFFGPHGSNWSDTNISQANLAPNVPVTYARYLIVGTGDIASVTDVIFDLRRQVTGSLAGKVSEEGTGAGVSETVIQVERSDAKSFNLIKPASNGSFQAKLPPGSYVLRASAVGRVTPRPVSVAVREGTETSTSVRVGLQGHVEYAVADAVSGKPIPAKITFRGLGDTRDPDLGPGYRAQGAANVIFNHTGNGETSLPPGLYDVTVSRGIEYTTYQTRISVEPGKTAKVAATLERVVDTSGFISGDFHLHSEYSTDSNVTLRDKVIGLVAEGVEFAVSSDHNNLADYRSAIKELGLERELKSTIGDEVTLSGTIHFNVFPLEIHPDRPRNGAIEPARMKVQEMIDAVRKDPGEEIVQLNHPRAGSIGYFHTSKFDSATLKSPVSDFTLDFDAIEVFNGKRVIEAEEVLHDWFNLLNAGYTFTATGNSDSHKLVSEEAGYPRNFVFLGKDDPSRVTEDELVAAVKSHKLIVSNGPFLRVQANGTHTMGDHFGSVGKPVNIRVQLQSASWVDIAQVVVIGNGEEIESRLVPETRMTDKGEFNFTLTPKVDTWYVVVVRGNRSLAPVVPQLGDRDVLPFAFSNPIWVDVDGDGKFTPVGVPK
jgi:hypothetical protein